MPNPTFYRLEPDDKGWGKDHHFDLDGRHQWTMPGIKCPQCGGWAITGVSYPSAVVPPGPLADALEQPRAVELSEYRRLSQDVQRLLGPQRPVFAGARLGPVRGTAEGNPPDCCWLDSRTVLFPSFVQEAISRAGFGLSGNYADVAFTAADQSSRLRLFEPEAIPSARLHLEDVAAPCEICGRVPVRLPRELVLDESSLSPDAALQRVVQFPSILICTSDFAEYVRTAGLQNVVLSPVESR